MSKTAVAPKPAQFDDVFDRVFTFKIRRHKAGSFKNLWNLSAKMHGGETLEIVDADSLDTVIDKIGFLFEQEGY